jgi:hypothetical protein
MADPKKDLENVNKELGFIEDTLLSIANSLSTTVKRAIEDLRDESKGVAEIYEKNLQKSIKDIAKNSDSIVSNQLKIASGVAKTRDIEKQILSNNVKREALTRIIQNLKNSGIKIDDKTLELQQETLKAIEDQNKVLNTQLEEVSKVQKKLGVTGDILKGISKIPLLGNLINAEEALAVAQSEAAKEGSNRAKVMGAAFKSLGSTLKENVSDPLTQITIALGFFKTATKYALEFNDTQIKLQRSLLISSESAKSLVDNMQAFAQASNNAYVNYVKLTDANIELNNALGTNVQLTAKQLEDNIELKEAAGLEADEREAIYKLSLLTGKTQENIFNTIGKQNKGVLSNKKVLSEVLKVSGQLAAQYKNNPELLGKAVIQAQKLGMTLEQTKNISKQLLNFEDSIASELEAELLTGMDLNLEKARYLALQGDSAGAARELMNNLGPNGLVKFQKMNVIQQEALAKSLGMGVDELADTLVKEKQLAALTGQQRKLIADAKQKLIDQGKIEEAQALEKNLLASKDVELALMERTEREKTAQNIENIKKSFFSFTNGPIATVIKGFNNIMEGINNSPILKTIIGFTGGATALIALGMGLVGSIKLLTGIFSKGAIPVFLTNATGITGGAGNTGTSSADGTGLGGNIKRATKAFSKGGMKGGLKSLGRIGKSALKGARGAGLIGTAIGLATELAEGGLNLESLGRAGITGISSFAGGALGSLIAPGVGTIAGGIGGGMAGDKLGDLIFGERKEMANGGIISKPTRALVGEAGPEAVIPLDKFYAKMDELISVIKSGGNVYLDGTKVGTAMTMGTYRTQ